MSDNFIYNNIENNYNYNSNQHNVFNQALPNPDFFDLSFDLSSEEEPSFINNLDNNLNNQYFLIKNKIPDKIYIENNDYNQQNLNFIKIFCPECLGFCSYKTKQNYKLHLECKCGHKKDYSISEYEDIIKNNNHKIRCMTCPFEADEMNCHYCIFCQTDLCNECKNNHSKDFGDEHQIIPYVAKYFTCLTHGEKYSSFCISCKKDLCPQCESEHNEQGHKIKPYNINTRKIDRKLEELKNVFNLYNEVFNNIMRVLKEKKTVVEKAVNFYSLLLNSHKKYRNQETLNNQRNFKMDYIKDIKKIINISKENNIFKTLVPIINLSDKISNSKSSIALYPKKVKNINNNKNIHMKKKKLNIFQTQSVEKINITSTININESEILQQEHIKNESKNEINSVFQMLKINEIKNFEITKNSEFVFSRVNSEADNPIYINVPSERNVSKINNNNNNSNNIIENNNIKEPEPISVELQLINNSKAIENQENLSNGQYIDRNNNDHIDKFESYCSDNYDEENINSLEYENIQEKHSQLMFFNEFEIYNNFSSKVSFGSEFKDLPKENQNDNFDKPIEGCSSIRAKSSSNADSNQYNDDSGKSNWFTESSKEKNKNIINQSNPFIIKVSEVNLIYRKPSSFYNIFVEKVKLLNNYLSDLWNKFFESFYYYKSNYFDLFFEMITKDSFWSNLYIKSFNAINNYCKENSINLPFAHKRIIKKDDTFLTNSHLINRKKTSFGSNIIKLNNVHRLINININQTKRKYNFSNLLNGIVCYSITQNNSGLIRINHQGNQFHIHILISHYGNKIICIAFLFNCVILLYKKKDGTYLIYNFPFGYICSNIIYRLICLFMKYFFHLNNIIK